MRPPTTLALAVPLAPASFCLIIALLLGGCATGPKPTAERPILPSKQEIVLAIAHQQIGVPYRFGGNAPQIGFDCSGLVRYAFQMVGQELPRTAYEQLKQSRKISVNELRPGDLVFFVLREKRRPTYHVGVYKGNGEFIHAPSLGKEVEIAQLENPYWKKRLVRGGRVI